MSEKQQAEKLRLNSNWDHREKAAGTHSAPRWWLVMWLAGLVLISCTLMGSRVVAQECTECDSDKSDVELYVNVEKKPPPCVVKGRCKRDCVPHPTLTCDKKSSPKNFNHPCCGLWRSIQTCKNDKTKCHDQKRFAKIGYTLFYEGKCHFLLVPTDPVIGVEDKKNRNKHNYWNDAWYAGDNGVWRIKHHKSTSLGLAINPATKRSQHQLHIHIGRLPKSVRDKLQAKHVKHDGHWHDLTINGKKCSAKFFHGNVPWPFTEVSRKFGESNMKHSGIIVAGSYYNESAGFYIVSFKDVFVEGLLNYNCPGH